MKARSLWSFLRSPSVVQFVLHFPFDKYRFTRSSALRCFLSNWLRSVSVSRDSLGSMILSLEDGGVSTIGLVIRESYFRLVWCLYSYDNRKSYSQRLVNTIGYIRQGDEIRSQSILLALLSFLIPGLVRTALGSCLATAWLTILDYTPNPARE